MTGAPDSTPEPRRDLRYPPYVNGEADRERWDLCERIAEELVGGPDADPAELWHFVRSIYRSDLPT